MKNAEGYDISKQVDMIKLETVNAYDTFINVKPKNGKSIFVLDLKSMMEFSNEIKKKLSYGTTFLVIFLFVQFGIQCYLSYKNLQDCETKINVINSLNESSQNSNHIIFLCSSYIIHIFFLIGFYVVAFIAIHRQTNLSYKMFEVYILVMFISDILLSFVNHYNFFHAIENMINYVLVKYILFLKSELERVNVAEE